MNAPPPLPTALERLPRSGIRVVMDQAWALGEPVVHLEVGEPGFATPPHIVEAFSRAATSGSTRYAPNAGIARLRDACALAGVAALEGPQQCVHDMVEQYRSRRDLAVDHARSLGLDPRVPASSFYLWLPLPDVDDSLLFAQKLLDRHRVAVAPGSTFGESGTPAIRLALTVDQSEIDRGLTAIGQLLDALGR